MTARDETARLGPPRWMEERRPGPRRTPRDSVAAPILTWKRLHNPSLRCEPAIVRGS